MQQIKNKQDLLVFRDKKILRNFQKNVNKKESKQSKLARTKTLNRLILERKFVDRLSSKYCT